MKKKESNASKLSSTFLSIDLFGRHIEFLENGKEAFTSHFGAFISALIIVVSITYGVSKMNILFRYGDSNLTEY